MTQPGECYCSSLVCVFLTGGLQSVSWRQLIYHCGCLKMINLLLRLTAVKRDPGGAVELLLLREGWCVLTAFLMRGSVCVLTCIAYVQFVCKRDHMCIGLSSPCWSTVNSEVLNKAAMFGPVPNKWMARGENVVRPPSSPNHVTWTYLEEPGPQQKCYRQSQQSVNELIPVSEDINWRRWINDSNVTKTKWRSGANISSADHHEDLWFCVLGNMWVFVSLRF